MITEMEAERIAQATEICAAGDVDVVVRRLPNGDLQIDQVTPGDYTELLSRDEFIPPIARFRVPYTAAEVLRQIRRTEEMRGDFALDHTPVEGGVQ